jgi:type VI secretion system secreted protein VgrG
LLDRTYVVTSVLHKADCPQADVLDVGDAAAADYEHELECLPIDVPCRPLERIEKPRVRGPHVGVVTGNQEIHTDRYGRIRVRMHWDSTVDERGDGTEPSCWIRVISPWGGYEHGFQAVPRVGSEVVIDYIDGDIDRPVCIGCLFNGQNKVLHDLPEERTRLTLRTRSSPGGDGFNELTFEDAAGPRRCSCTRSGT